MLATFKDYILCYSPAYILGAVHGCILAAVLRDKPSKAAQWRRNK